MNKGPNITRRDLLASTGVYVLVGALVSGTALAANEVVSLSQFDLRCKALTKCNWPDFQRDQISLSESSIQIGSITLEFDDETELIKGTDCGDTLSKDDIFQILGAVGGSPEQQQFFFSEVLGMRQEEYWLSDRFMVRDRQNTLILSKIDGVTVGGRGDGWGSIEDELPVRKKI